MHTHGASKDGKIWKQFMAPGQNFFEARAAEEMVHFLAFLEHYLFKLF
jgi:hypothetical protein